MANEADQAAEAEEIFLKVSLLNAQSDPNKLEVEPEGECLFCFEPLAKPRRWCDKTCMDDWQRTEDGLLRKSGHIKNPSAKMVE
ncbi:hypothetical protein V0M98_39110 (plasmid) [Pseudomonas silesiensis]|uniref:hypothetical protein n=1 Tax=Pseudomonas silesiensis TaxID=1853130 RepID=UPI0030D41216